MAIFLLLGVPIAMVSEVARLAVPSLLHQPSYLKVFTPDQTHALVSLLLRLHGDGITIAAIFWRLWLFPMGYLVFASGFLPKFIGVFLIIAGLGYVIQSLSVVLLPNHKVNIALFTGWGELFLALWLLVRGVDVEKWETRARQAA
jgi:hypothetical protein